MSGRLLGGCETVARVMGLRFNCCDSCHDDDDAGYAPMCEREAFNGDWIHICCGTARRLDDVDIPWEALRAALDARADRKEG